MYSNSFCRTKAIPCCCILCACVRVCVCVCVCVTVAILIFSFLIKNQHTQKYPYKDVLKKNCSKEFKEISRKKSVVKLFLGNLKTSTLLNCTPTWMFVANFLIKFSIYKKILTTTYIFSSFTIYQSLRH